MSSNATLGDEWDMERRYPLAERGSVRRGIWIYVTLEETSVVRLRLVTRARAYLQELVEQ